jgi:hypothetical protein
LEAVQCAPQQQLLVVEVVLEEEFAHEMGFPKWELAGTQEGSQ